MDLSKNKISLWQKALIHWFRKSGRNYPWRETDDPYAILVSELMLQQTQIKTVLERRFFENWLHKFPDVKTLADAETDHVLKAWEGLGYYNRARNLQKAAKTIVADHGGRFPETYEEILSLPGVGPYTAGAVYSFAFNRPAPIVDGNVNRVLSRVFDFREAIDSTAGKKEIWSKADALTSPTHPREYNSAIMELGQRICRKGKPDCAECPVSKWCESSHSPQAISLPVKSKSIKITRKKEEVVLLMNRGKVFLSREAGTRRNGLWKLPNLKGSDYDNVEETGQLTYPITRYQVNMKIFSPLNLKNAVEIAKNYDGVWYDLSAELPAVGAPYLRAIEESLRSKDGKL